MYSCGTKPLTFYGAHHNAVIAFGSLCRSLCHKLFILGKHSFIFMELTFRTAVKSKNIVASLIFLAQLFQLLIFRFILGDPVLYKINICSCDFRVNAVKKLKIFLYKCFMGFSCLTGLVIGRKTDFCIIIKSENIQRSVLDNICVNSRFLCPFGQRHHNRLLNDLDLAVLLRNGFFNTLIYNVGHPAVGSKHYHPVDGLLGHNVRGSFATC